MVDSSPMDNFGSAIIQVLDKSTLISRLKSVMQIVDEINFLELRYFIRGHYENFGNSYISNCFNLCC